MPTRRRTLAAYGLLALVLSAPVWGFELLYRYGLHGEKLPEPSAANPALPTLMQDALWVATGEQLGSGVKALWVGNYFRATSSPANGRAAALAIAHSVLLEADPELRLRNLQHRVRPTAVAVALTRRWTEDDLKQELVTRSYFGRGAYGAADAAIAYYGVPLNRLTPGELALLAVLPQAPSRYEPSRFADRALKRRAFVLEELQASGRLSAAEFGKAAAEPLRVLPEPE